MTLDAVRDGGKIAVARVLAKIEERPDDPGVIALLDAAWAAPHAQIIGLTGPPGVGKSTLIDALIKENRRAGRRIAVVAVDPSSQRTGGALLGDRTRFGDRSADPDVFVRSLASRGRLGGLADLAFPAVTLLAALYDRVLVETVGVGQSEASVGDVADAVVLCVQPGSGDSLQFMKAGIMELPDVAVVTKADVGAAATRALSDLNGAFSLGAEKNSVDFGRGAPVCLAVSAAEGTGIVALEDAVGDLLASHGPRSARSVRAAAWLDGVVRARFGSAGISALQEAGVAMGGDAPFSTAHEALARLRVVLAADVSRDSG
ncbi:MAG: GTP-binding protein [Pseudomonadota bacterium]